MKILIQGGRVLDPQSKTDAVADVAISAGKIVAIGKAPDGFQAQKTIDAKGCIVMPGLVDLSVRPVWCAHPTLILCWTSQAL